MSAHSTSKLHCCCRVCATTKLRVWCAGIWLGVVLSSSHLSLYGRQIVHFNKIGNARVVLPRRLRLSITCVPETSLAQVFEREHSLHGYGGSWLIARAASTPLSTPVHFGLRGKTQLWVTIFLLDNSWGIFLKWHDMKKLPPSQHFAAVAKIQSWYQRFIRHLQKCSFISSGRVW